MAFDVEGARKEGYSDQEIAQHLANEHRFDIAGAQKEGYTDADIIKHLSSTPASTKEKQPANPFLPAEMGILGGGAATAYKVGQEGFRGAKNVVRKAEELLDKAKEAKRPPPSDKPFAPQTPVDKYGKAMHGGVYGATQDMSEMYKAGEEATQFKKANPAWTVKEGSGLAMPPDLKAKAPVAKAPGVLSRLAAPVKAGAEALAPVARVGARIAAPILGGFEAGMQGGEALNRNEVGDTTGAVISGIGALGSAGMMVPNPMVAIPGAIASTAAPLINKYRDAVRKGRIVHGAPEAPENMDAMGNTYAEGGEVESAPFVGYPQIKNKPRDPNFRQQTGPALGYLDALLGMGQREDLSPLNKQDSAYMDAYSKAEPYGIAAGVLPFGGMTKAVKGAKAATKAGDIAEHILRQKGLMPAAAHEIGGSEVGKMSDWAQNHMNKFIVPTQADRMGGVGGPSYSANQLGLPQYENRAWGSGQPGTATQISNIAKDPRFGGTENQLFAPLLGKDTMHQSNQIVFDTMLNEFYKHPERLTPELRAKINEYLQSGGLISGKTKGFDPIPGFDIADRGMVEDLGKTFKNRGLIAQHAFGGVDIGGKKAQIIPYRDILNETMDPLTQGAKPFSVGPRAFQLSGEVEAAPRPDLNRAYPFQLHGKDLGVTYQPVPSELALMDFQNQWRKDTGKTTPLKSGALPQPGYFEHTVGYKTNKNGPRTYPRQQITEDFIKELQRSGFKKGGLA